MGATCLTLPSCPPDLGSFCRLDELGLQVVVNGSSPVVRCWPAGSSRPTSSPVVSPLRMRGCAARQRDPAAGARTAGVAPDDVADHDPPLSLPRLWTCVAPGHQPGYGRGPIEAGVQDLARRARHVLARRRRSGCDGQVRRVQDCQQRGTARRGHGDGPVPRRAPSRRCSGPVPPPRPAGHLRARRPQGRPLYAARRLLHTGAALLTENQQARLEALFAVSEHVEVEATWGIYQRMIAADRRQRRPGPADRDPQARHPAA
jgi:hypothetical protein